MHVSDGASGVATTAARRGKSSEGAGRCDGSDNNVRRGFSGEEKKGMCVTHRRKGQGCKKKNSAGSRWMATGTHEGRGGRSTLYQDRCHL